MSAIPEMLAANERYASSFEHGDLAAPPRRRVAVLCCMDARLLPSKLLGLAEGDAHVISNAGGRASSDALRSLIISHKLLGTREFLVIHHTDCGMMTVDNNSLRKQLRADTGTDPEAIDFLGFSDLEQSVRDDVATIRSSPFIPDEIPVRGFVYDVQTGRLREID